MVKLIRIRMKSITLILGIIFMLGCISSQPAASNVVFDSAAISQRFTGQTGICFFGNYPPLGDVLIHLKVSDNPQLDQTINAIAQPPGENITLTDIKGNSQAMVCYTQSAYQNNTIKYISCANETYCGSEKAPIAFIVEYGTMRNAYWSGKEIRLQ
jgi:hypothetical protein